MTHTEQDRFFGPAFHDVDEHRTVPIPHRYVHGGFEGTNTRFRIRFPDEGYRGRMLMVLGGGMGGTEFITDDDEGDPRHVSPYRGLREAADRGAFLVEGNEGFRGGVDAPSLDHTIGAYRANAAVARYAIELATQHHGAPPAHRYVAGFSGGGNRTVKMLEETRGLFDGGVAGGLAAIDETVLGWSIVAEAQHVLRDVLPDVIANADAGGSGDVFAAVRTAEQREALAKLYAAGYPFGNERGLLSGLCWYPGWHYLGFRDPSYERDFFETPGYAGRDGLVGRIRGEATVTHVLDGDGGAAGIRLDVDREPVELIGATISTSDEARGVGPVPVTGVSDGPASGAFLTFFGAAGFVVGDRVIYDNSRWVALRHHHRDAYRRTIDPRLAPLAYTGDHAGKLLLVQLAHDHLTLTSVTHDVASRIANRDEFRMWWIEWGDHAGESARIIDNAGPFHRALDDLIAWVEDAVEPPPSTPYELDADGILRLPDTQPARGGIQPTVTLEAGGARRSRVRVGEPVTLRASAAAPAGDEVIEIAWDPFGTAEWEPEGHAAAAVVAERVQVYPDPGVVLAGVRVRSRRPGWPEPVDNVSVARIVVEA